MPKKSTPIDFKIHILQLCPLLSALLREFEYHYLCKAFSTQINWIRDKKELRKWESNPLSSPYESAV